MDQSALFPAVAQSEPGIYIGRKRCCGAIRAASVDDPKYAKDVARDISEMVRSGLIVERVIGTVTIGKCSCETKGAE